MYLERGGNNEVVSTVAASNVANWVLEGIF